MGPFKRKRDEEKDDVVIESSGSTHEQKESSPIVIMESASTHQAESKPSRTDEGERAYSKEDVQRIMKRTYPEEKQQVAKPDAPVVDVSHATHENKIAKGFAQVGEQLESVGTRLGQTVKKVDKKVGDKLRERAEGHDDRQRERERRQMPRKTKRISRRVAAEIGGTLETPPDAWYYGDSNGGDMGMGMRMAMDPVTFMMGPPRVQAPSGGQGSLNMGADFGRMMLGDAGVYNILNLGTDSKGGASMFPMGGGVGPSMKALKDFYSMGTSKKGKKVSDPMRDFYTL